MSYFELYAFQRLFGTRADHGLSLSFVYRHGQRSWCTKSSHPPVHVRAAGSVHGETRPVVAEGHNVTWQQGTSGKTVSPELCAEERLSGGPAGGLQQATRNAAPHLQTWRERAQGGRGGGAAHWRGIDEEASGPALTWRPSGAPRWPGRTPLVAGRRRRDPRWRQ